MSLQEEIWLEFHKFYEAGRRGDSYDGLPESNKIINKVLDAAVEAANSVADPDFPPTTVIKAINKLRGES